MQLSKSYQLLRFLNKSHIMPSRLLFFSGIWLITYLSSFSIKLANNAASNIWRNDYKSAFRLANWYLSFGFFNLKVSIDPFFNFTTEMEQKELLALLKFVEWRGEGKDKFNYLSNKLYVLAALAHESLVEKNITQYHIYLKEYNDVADEVLSNLSKIKANNLQKDMPKDNVFSTQDASVALNDFAELGKKLNLKWYVISGTFLGVVRDKGWIAHDYDIDLGVNVEDFDLENFKKYLEVNPNMVLRKEDWLIRIIKKDGEPAIERIPTLLKLVHKTGINVDLFIHHLEDGKRWHGSIIHQWSNYDFALKSYNLADQEVFGPDNPDLYLTENYGDWKTPVKDFNSTTGTPNLTIVNNLFSITLFIKRLGFYVRNAQISDYEALLSKLSLSALFIIDSDIELDLSSFK